MTMSTQVTCCVIVLSITVLRFIGFGPQNAIVSVVSVEMFIPYLFLSLFNLWDDFCNSSFKCDIIT
jgi:hypothetical protein